MPVVMVVRLALAALVVRVVSTEMVAGEARRLAEQPVAALRPAALRWKEAAGAVLTTGGVVVSLMTTRHRLVAV